MVAPTATIDIASVALVPGHLTLVTVAHLFAQFIAGLCGLGAIFGIVYTVTACRLIGRFFARGVAVPARFPAVTIVKPLHGDEWRLEAHLASFFDQDYPGPVQYLFGVHDSCDPALAAVERLRERYPDAHVTVVADARLYGPNRKIANLVNMLEKAEHEVLCFADSDVYVERNYLRQIVGTLQQPGVGLVTTVYRGLCAPGFWPRLAAALTNYHFLPGVVTGLALGRARPCFGQSIAMTRDMLARIGGLAQFAHHLAEDHAVGEAVRRAGATVAIPPIVVQHACVENTFSKLFAHELRWSRTIRAADRSGHLGAVFMHPLALALLAVAFSGGAPAAWALAGVALFARALLVWRTDRATGQKGSGLLCLPIWDAVQFAIYLASFCSSGVVWRGTRFRVDANGMLSPVHEK
ncbi:glycosyltransferase [Paraburkholderia pallida]|uniref:Glycosyltransferase n=2 Tax=Paraburkholderia pallida TaxID=2547399 RepID=A0A4P7D1Z0_9BURK|nr:bacteriohopanetetrol glucosamine biosynthesis glycosyltransferase HpnI [Paraburkholderia pallida]QBR01217.1 glycosyltransferase [Paraburkholderia pallida]